MRVIIIIISVIECIVCIIYMTNIAFLYPLFYFPSFGQVTCYRCKNMKPIDLYIICLKFSRVDFIFMLYYISPVDLLGFELIKHVQ